MTDDEYRYRYSMSFVNQLYHLYFNKQKFRQYGDFFLDKLNDAIDCLEKNKYRSAYTKRALERAIWLRNNSDRYVWIPNNLK